MSRCNRGVTLIELLVVIVVVGILAAIAYPSYRDQVRRSNRTEAKVALEQSAQALEKCFTRYMSYDSENCAAAMQLEGGGVSTPHGYYVITGNIDNSTFVLTATPQGGQRTDTKCPTLTMTETGARGVNGQPDQNKCW